jgi:hypothetical protein
MARLRIRLTVDIPDQQLITGIEWNVVERDLRASIQHSIKRDLGENRFAFVVFNEICSIDDDLQEVN